MSATGPDTAGPSVREAVPDRFALGEWVVDAMAGRFIQGEESVHVEPKVMEVLLALAAEQGDVVSRERLFDLVWPDVIVTDSAINRSVSDLRRVLGDDPRRPTYIETIPKVGYRLLVPVDPLPSMAGDGLGRAGEPPPPPLPPDLDGVSGDGMVSTRADAEPVVARPQETPRPAGRGWRRGGLWGVLVAVAAAVGAAAWLGRGAPFDEVLAQADARVLTTIPGAETQAAVSPDGKRVAFVTSWPETGGPRRIYVQSLAGSAPREVAEDAMWPTWSPDGTRIAFQRSAVDRAPGSFRAAIYVVTEYGTDERLLAEGEVALGGMAWSPDGSTIVYPGLAEGGERGGLFALDVASGEARRLTTADGPQAVDIRPTFSPDGEQIAFVRLYGGATASVFVVTSGGGEPRRLTASDEQVAGVTWSPSGDAVVYSSDRTGLFRLWAVSPTGGKPERLAVPAQDPGGPSISPIGTLVFADWRYDTNVWVQAPGESPRPVLSTTTWDEEPALSPDGRRVAFVSTRSGTPQVWAGPVDGGEARQLTTHDGVAVHAPRWSPDGESVAYQARMGDDYDVFVVPVEGGAPRVLAGGAGDDVNPRWSRDGRSVYVGSERDGSWDVWRVPLAGGEPEKATATGAFVGEESLDGERILFMRPRESGLFSVARGGGEPERVADLPPQAWADWHVTTGGVYGVVPIEGLPYLARLTASGPEVMSEPLRGLTPRRASVAVSGDGTTWAWGRVDRAENDLMVIEGLGGR